MIEVSTIYPQEFRFDVRARPMPAEMRPMWRVAVLALALSRSRKRSATLRKLHVLNWCLRNDEAREMLRSVFERELPPNDLVIRFEPALMRALAFGIAEQLFELDNGRIYRLAKLGGEFVSAIDSDPTCLSEEKLLLQQVAPRLTEKLVEQLIGLGQLR